MKTNLFFEIFIRNDAEQTPRTLKIVGYAQAQAAYKQQYNKFKSENACFLMDIALVRQLLDDRGKIGPEKRYYLVGHTHEGINGAQYLKDNIEQVREAIEEGRLEPFGNIGDEFYQDGGSPQWVKLPTLEEYMQPMKNVQA